MFLNGLKDGVTIFVATVVSGVAVHYLINLQVALNISLGMIVIGSVYFGYKYYPKYGPMLISDDKKAFNKLFMYALGFCMLFSISVTAVNFMTTKELNVFTTIVMAFISIPLTAMSFMAMFFIGRVFNNKQTS